MHNWTYRLFSRHVCALMLVYIAILNPPPRIWASTAAETAGNTCYSQHVAAGTSCVASTRHKRPGVLDRVWVGSIPLCLEHGECPSLCRSHTPCSNWHVSKFSSKDQLDARFPPIRRSYHDCSATPNNRHNNYRETVCRCGAGNV